MGVRIPVNTKKEVYEEVRTGNDQQKLKELAWTIVRHSEDVFCDESRKRVEGSSCRERGELRAQAEDTGG